MTDTSIPQRKSRAPKNTPVQRIKDQLARNPGLTNKELAKLNNVDDSAICRLLQRHNITRDKVEDYKLGRADLLAGLQESILAHISPEDLKKASLRDKVIAAATLYDKERLERGLSTSNTAVVYASAVESALKKPVDMPGPPQDVVVEVIEDAPR